MIGELELDQLVPMAGRIPRLDGNVLRQWIDVTRRRFESRAAADSWTLLAATLVWCKHAEGTLSFSIGAKSVEVAFRGLGPTARRPAGLAAAVRVSPVWP